MFEVRSLCKNFGGLAAISQLNLEVDEGEIRGVIGPNGAGKTTLFNVICGVYKPTKGKIAYQGKEISGLKSSQIAERGVVRTFQRTALFHHFTVLDNVLVARHLQARGGFFRTIFGTNRRIDIEQEKKALEIIDFMGLSDLKDELADNLPHGHQRALGIAVALASEPKLLMLDEPVTGMDPTETQHMTGLIKKIRDERAMTILLVEHDMKVVMGICDKISVLNFGKKLAEGLPKQILENPDVIEAYLGGEDVVALLG
ncbi:MAG: ABC transporter ATP-binding protein [Deltaproteobacteria bacterium]|nr:ABC transporter ATP-binding protein [Candidatus Desulfobacula maris]MBL6993382.1 ABC transporter ATP-binding protein [Desulfobacula sp.]